MVDIQSATKKERKKPQDENIMVCPIPYRATITRLGKVTHIGALLFQLHGHLVVFKFKKVIVIKSPR